MNRNRLRDLFVAAGINENARRSGDTLGKVVAKALRTIGLKPTEEKAVSTAAQEVTTSFANIGVGVGFASWVVYEASHGIAASALDTSIDAMFGHAETWAGFVIDTLQHPETWPDVAHLIQHAIENAATMPIGSIQLVADIIEAWDHSGPFLENLDALGVAGELVDVADAATTLGLSLALSYLAGKFVDNIVEQKLRPRQERLKELQQQSGELLRLRQMLQLGVPSPALAPQLDKVAAQHWGF